MNTLAVISANAIVRSGLAQLLASVPGVKVSEAGTGDTGGSPDLVVLDLHEHRAGRVGVAFWAAQPAGSRFVALIRPDDPPNLPLAIKSGARALLTRDTAAAELTVAVQTAVHGGLHVSRELLGPLVAQSTAAPGSQEPRLAAREVETLRLVAQGLTNGQISRRLGLTEATVSTYVKRIRAKLNAGNKAELTRRAVELGYLTPR